MSTYKLIVVFLVLIGFGFNISGTKEISIHREDIEKSNEIISSILLINFALFLVSILIELLTFVIPIVPNYKLLTILTLWMSLYEVVSQIWYCQEKDQEIWLKIII